MNEAKKRSLHTAWLAQSNLRALTAPYAPLIGLRALNIDTPVEEVSEIAAANCEIVAAQKTDALNVAVIDAGPAFLPSLFGAGYTRGGGTSWSTPCAAFAADLRIPAEFNPAHLPLWGEYERRLSILLARAPEDGYLPGMADYPGPLDVLAALLGPENCCLALALEPETVQEKLREIVHFLGQVIRYENALIHSAGWDGVTDCFALWMPGTGVRMSDDFSTLISAEHFSEFGVAADRELFEKLDTPILHLHSGAIRHIPALMTLKKLRAVELGNDPNGPSLEERIDAGRKVLAAGKALQFSSWEIPLSTAERARARTELGAAGMLYRFQSSTLAEADAWYAEESAK